MLMENYNHLYKVLNTGLKSWLVPNKAETGTFSRFSCLNGKFILALIECWPEHGHHDWYCEVKFCDRLHTVKPLQL